MHGMELHTAVRYKIPLIVVVINNSALGNVYLRAKSDGNRAAELLTDITPTQDWAAFARSLGAKGVVVEKPDELADAYNSAMNHIKSGIKIPFVIDVRCDKKYETPNP